MLSSLLALAAAATTPTTYSISAPMHAPAGAPSWSDEFNRPALDRSKWRFDTSRNKLGWFNGEQQYYSTAHSNVRVENGLLVIQARHNPLEIKDNDDWGGQQYSS